MYARAGRIDSAAALCYRRSVTRPLRYGLILILAFAALYLLTLDNGLRPGELEGGDLITHQYAQVLGRPSNAPGYPLYTMGGWLWFHAGRAVSGPPANPIPILSSYSTLWALLALALLYALLLEVGASPPVAFLSAAFYGVTYFFWYYAITTEQYTSSVAWTLAVILLAFRWERTRRDGPLLAIAFLVGVGLAHQLTVLLIMPPLLWFVLGLDPGLLRRPRLIAVALGLAALPLLSYGFIYAQGVRHPEWRGAGGWTSNWQWFWSFVSTRQGRDELTWALRPLITAEFPALIWRELTWPGLLAGLAGLALIGRRRTIFLYATLALYLLFCWIDRLGNWYQVIMPAYAILVVGIGALAAYLMKRAEGRAARAAVLGALALLVAFRGVTAYPRADASNRPEDTGLDPGWAIVGDSPPANTAVLGSQSENLALEYLTHIWGLRPDLRAVTAPEAKAALAAGIPALAVTEAVLPLVPVEVDADARYSAIGGRLSALLTAPQAAPLWDPAAVTALGWQAEFGPDLRIRDAALQTNTATGETALLLAWEAIRPAGDWSVSVRMLRDGVEIAQEDQAHPVFGAYPTSRWVAGEVVGDAYRFPKQTSAGADGARIIVYRQLGDGTFENLGVAEFALAAAGEGPTPLPPRAPR